MRFPDHAAEVLAEALGTPSRLDRVLAQLKRPPVAHRWAENSTRHPRAEHLQTSKLQILEEAGTISPELRAFRRRLHAELIQHTTPFHPVPARAGMGRPDLGRLPRRKCTRWSGWSWRWYGSIVTVRTRSVHRHHRRRHRRRRHPRWVGSCGQRHRRTMRHRTSSSQRSPPECSAGPSSISTEN